MREIGYCFIRLGISPKDLENLILNRVDLMKNMSSSEGTVNITRECGFSHTKRPMAHA